MKNKHVYKYHKPFESNVYYHETVTDWLLRLRKQEDDMDYYDYLNLLVLVNNWISMDMKWHFSYLIDFDDKDYTITLTGFPKFGFPEYFMPEKLQLHWLLNRIGYHLAKVYFKQHEVVKIELIYEEKVNPTLVEFITIDEDDNEILDDTSNENECNILDDKHKHHEHKIDEDIDRGVDKLDI